MWMELGKIDRGSLKSVCDPRAESLNPNVFVGSLDRLIYIDLGGVDRVCVDGFK
jgi:hypothetical protein